MKSLLRAFGPLHLLALLITALPLMALPALGGLWLWQSGAFWYWVAGLTLSGVCGYGLHRLALARETKNATPETAGQGRPVTGPGEHWPPSAQTPWQAVTALADEVDPAEWPLADGARLWQLGRDTLETVARHYHPHRKNPLLEMTLPHALLIIERASQELRQRITDHVPFSHRLTLGAVSRARGWKEQASRLETLYRVGYGVLDPSSVVFREFRREMGNRILGYGSRQVQTWLLQEYVRKVGYYAIELYSGKLLLSGEPPGQLTDESARQRQSSSPRPTEPLRILLLGRSNAGKSSLINGLFGELTAAEDVLADTTGEVSAYRLERSGMTQALVLDTPGLDASLLSTTELQRQLDSADLVLWVSAAHRPDREQERQHLDRVRDWLQRDPDRRPPSMLFVLSHIDRLRPLREWQPPYDLQQGDSPKAQSIRAATQAAARDLGVAPESMIPVCLHPQRRYNLDDTLWAAMLSQQDEALRVRLLRCIHQQRRRENWSLLRQQLVNSGRLLVSVAAGRRDGRADP
ncbi:MAG: GTPase [Oleiphilaceae bacterium]|nr:GTPase [Oleiphilaceae bacterium]